MAQEPDSRIPVIVGAGQLRANRERTVEGAREPLALLLEALHGAAAPALLEAADAVYGVRVTSWTYDSLAATVARAVGAKPSTLVDSALGGHLPVRLLEQAAARIWAGDSSVALIVGGEAQASLGALTKAGVDPLSLGWSSAPGGPYAFGPEDLGSVYQQASGLMMPTRVYPLFENRLQADLGLTPAEGAAWSAELYADLSKVAAAHASAWNREVLTPEQVAMDSRMVCEPYRLAVNAMPHVDQAAAVVVTSLQAARDHGIPDDQIVYVWGGSGADDTVDPLARASFAASSAMAAALEACLDQAGATSSDLDLIDVYSCFPVVPKLAGLALGLPRGALLSVAGGHSSFGGPLNSYALHALATMVDRLRAAPGTGLVHGNGGYLTYHHAMLLSSRQHPGGYLGSPEPSWKPPVGPEMLTPEEAVGKRLTVETATVEHDRAGGPRQAFVVARTADGARVAASSALDDTTTPAALSLAALPTGARSHIGREVEIIGTEVRVVGRE